MKSPAEMKTIQIEVTNACHKSCSNCTRFCGEHPKPFFMDVDTFKKAVDSMEGFDGIVGVMGGEPTLHPQFSELVDYYESKVEDPRPKAFIGDPTPTFKEYGRMVKYERGRKRGLWSALGTNYYKHFEQIQDVFAHQVVNDHHSVSTHQAILVTRKELGIPDDEWVKLRDNCWVQNLWSASITPKGAFFCEIAGALDMLFNGPGGWPIEPGWWKRKPSEFGDQLKWCEMCSCALKVPANNANDDTDIVSPKMLEKLKEVNGPKIRNDKFVILDTNNFDHSKCEGHERDQKWYLPKDWGDEARIAADNTINNPRKLDVMVRSGESNKSTLTRDQVENLNFKDWVAVFRDGSTVNAEFLESIPKCVLNPGCFYTFKDQVWLFNRRARAIRKLTNINLDQHLSQLWEKKKRIELKSYPNIARQTMGQKISLRMKYLKHRSAFLVPEFLLKKHNRGNSGPSPSTGTLAGSAGSL